LESQKTANSQGNTEQKEQCWGYQNTQLQTILQSHSNKADMKTGGTDEPDLKPYNYAHLVLDKVTKKYNREKIVSSTNVAGKTEYGMQKNETRSMSFTLCKYQLKVSTLLI
jgi:hypothetical protein